MQWNGILLFDFTLLQYYKPQYNSFKIVFDLLLIKAINLHQRRRIKIYFLKKELVRTLNSKKLKISHIFYY